MMPRFFTSIMFNIGAQTSPHKERAMTWTVDAGSFGEARQMAISSLIEERRRHPIPARRKITINRVNITQL